MERGHYIETVLPPAYSATITMASTPICALYEQAKLDQWNAATDVDWRSRSTAMAA
jgi:hypothetical protein